MPPKDFFDKENSPHGLSKLVVLYRYLEKKIGIALNTREPCVGYDFTYFDAFCGTGKYQVNMEPQDVGPLAKEQAAETDLQAMSNNKKQKEHVPYHQVKAGAKTSKKSEKTGPPFPVNYGSPLVALEALVKIFKERYSKDWNKTFLFVFEDEQQQYVDKLKENVRSYLKASGVDPKWIEEEPDKWKIVIKYSRQAKKGAYINVSLAVNIRFIVGQFQHFDLDQPLFKGSKIAFAECKPMVTFLDPFGYSDTPMERVVQYLGNRRDVLIFFGVKWINRFKKVQKQEHNFVELMGDENWKWHLPENYKALSTPDRMKALVTAYGECLQMNQPDETLLRTCHISMREGSSKGEVDKGFLYDLIGICQGLKSLSQMKYAMGVGSQNTPKEFGNDLYFSDYHYDANGTWSPLSSRPAEADIIYEGWRGQTCTFGQLKEWILTETSLQIHSRVLLDLERDGILTVVNSIYRTKVMVDQIVNVPEEMPTVANYPTPTGNTPIVATTVVNTPTMSSTVINTPTPVFVKEIPKEEKIATKTDHRKKKAFPSYVGQLNDDPDEDELKGDSYKYRNDWVLQFVDCDDGDDIVCKTAELKIS